MEETSDRMNKASSQAYIKISDIKTSNNKLVVKLEFSEDIRKYFTTDRFVAEYDKNIEDVDESILVIPPLSTVITVAWATGADIYVKNLDKSYLDSLNKLRQTFKKWYPQFSSSGKIHVQNIITNEFNNEGYYALLFSGGVDSLTSYLRHKDERPTLISMWGVDIPTHEYKFWNKIRSMLLNFATEEGVNICFIKTTADGMLNNSLLASEYRIKNWWESVSHGLIILGSCAPLTLITKIGTIYIASSTYTHDFNIPWGSHPFIDNNISWADIKIINDGPGISRQEKIRVLKNTPHLLSYLRVCYSQYQEYNCGYCEKCLRTITGLILENIDPKLCNFNIKDNILNLVQIYLSKGLLEGSAAAIATTWQEMQKHIPDNIGNTEVSKKYNSKEFFEWFRNFDFSNYKYNKNILSYSFKLYLLLRYKGVTHLIKWITRYISKRLKTPIK